MLTISGVTYRVGGKRGRALLNDATAQIPEGSKLGLVGRNGIGKSTLLDLIRGRLTPDDGDIYLPRGHRIGFLAQEAPSGAGSPLATVLAADRERARLLAELDADPSPLRIAEIEERLETIGARAAPGRAARILAGLGFDAAMQETPIDELSGGWRMRIALAAVLFAEPDLLLLDEPTNHLDMEASLWLERYLRRYRHSFVVVSHDRQLLNAATTATLHLEGGKLTLYSGNFDAFLRARGAVKARQAAMAKRQEAQRRHMQEFVDRFRYKASKARQAQSRLKALAKLEPVSVIAEAPPIELSLPEPPVALRPPLITLEHASVGYAADRPVLSGLDLRLDPDDRIALLGANGNGKTTFARLLAGRLAPMSGKMTRPPKLVSGFFAQHQIEEMRRDESAYDHLAALLPELPPEAIRTRLGRFGFGQDKAFVPIASLSGGERARLNLALVTHDSPALLILDEPTNHLDMETRESLVAALADYSGAVVLVSHDWHLIELVADRLWLVADGTVVPFDGDLDAYRRRLSERDDTPAEERPGERTRRPAERDERRATRRDAAEQRLAVEPLRREARRAEAAAAQLAAEQKALDARLAAPGKFAGGTALADALKQRADLARRIAEAEARWLAAEEAIERSLGG